MATTDNADDIKDVLSSGARKSLNVLKDYDYENGPETKKLLGLVEMDAGIATAFEAFYNSIGGDYMRSKIAPHVYDRVLEYAKRHGVQGSNLYRTASSAALGLNLAFYLLPFAGGFVDKWKEQTKERRELLHKIAPVLDDIMGNHSMSAFSSVKKTGEKGNEVIYAARYNMQKVHTTTLINEALAIAGKVGLNFAAEASRVQEILGGKSPHDVARAQELVLKNQVEKKLVNKSRKTIAEYMGIRPAQVTTRHFDKAMRNARADMRVANSMGPLSKETAERIPNAAKVMDLRKTYSDNYFAALDKLRNPEPVQPANGAMGNMDAGRGSLIGGNVLLTTLADRWRVSSTRKLDKSMPAFSALEMITHLATQLQTNTDSPTFQMPKGNDPFTLEEYVVQIFAQHQRVMSAIDPKYTILRDGLSDNLNQIAGILAKSIRSGDLDPLFLIRLVGEGQIILNKGRGLATPEMVERLVRQQAGKVQEQITDNPKEYASHASFINDDVKEILPHLQGEERILFSLLLPDWLLKEAGMGANEIQEIGRRRSKEVNLLPRMVAALDAQSDEELKKIGAGDGEIAKLREIAKVQREQGEGAAHLIKVEGGGLRQLVANVIVPQMKIKVGAGGEAGYLGKLADTGKKIIEGATHEAQAADAQGEDARKKFADKVGSKKANAEIADKATETADEALELDDKAAEMADAAPKAAPQKSSVAREDARRAERQDAPDRTA